MANTFEDQARERFDKSTAFLGKARTLLQDDLVARTVLADAVSAIKNMLQGYLLVRISRAQPGMMTQEWQEVAASNRMPELIRTCVDAGLNIRDLGRPIRQLNDERNIRTHDDPQSRVQIEQARQAMELARSVAIRVNAAIKTSQVAVPSPVTIPSNRVGISNNYAPASRPAAASVASAPVPTASPSTPAAAASVTTATPPAPASATPATPTVTEADDVDDEGQATQDDTSVLTIPGASRHRAPGGNQVRGVFPRVAMLAAVLVVGVAAGFGGAVTIAAHGAPTWLGFARSWLTPSQAVLTVQAKSSLNTVPATQTVGALTVTGPSCQGHLLTFTLSNTSANLLPWAVVNTAVEQSSVGFSFTPTGTPQAAAVGTMPANSYITVYVTGPKSASPFHVEAFGPGGTVQIIAPTCG